MTDKPDLQPLTPEASELFERRRESAGVLQSKCTSCNAWYETIKKSYAFEEKFQCDCGAEMRFQVPPAEVNGVVKPTNEQIILIGGKEFRLDTGMTVEEALRRSAAWWEDKGRRMMQDEHKRQSQAVGGSKKGAGTPFASQDTASANYLPSAIIHGKPWEALGQRERLMIVKVWHHFNVRNPDLIGEDRDAKHKMQDRGRIQ